MNNMINTFLENAKQTIIRTRTALESVVGTHHNYNDYESLNDEMIFAGSANANAEAADIISGFNAGEGMPSVWE